MGDVQEPNGSVTSYGTRRLGTSGAVLPHTVGPRFSDGDSPENDG